MGTNHAKLDCVRFVTTVLYAANIVETTRNAPSDLLAWTITTNRENRNHTSAINRGEGVASGTGYLTPARFMQELKFEKDVTEGSIAIMQYSDNDGNHDHGYIVLGVSRDDNGAIKSLKIAESAGGGVNGVRIRDITPTNSPVYFGRAGNGNTIIKFGFYSTRPRNILTETEGSL